MSLRQALTALRRWWWLLAVLALLGTGAAAVFGQALTKQYTASTALLFSVDRSRSVTELAQGSAYTQGIVKSYSRVATLPVVLDPVIQRLGLPDTSQALARRISIEIQPDTVLMTISATDESPARAADIANAVAQELSAAVVTLSPGGGSSAVGVTATTTGAARAPAEASFPNVRLLVALGLLGGLVLGAAGIGLLESFRSPLLTAEAVESTAPVLARLPRVPEKSLTPEAFRKDRTSQYAEAVRVLRTTLRHREGTDTSRCIVVTSPMSGDGRTTVAIALAAALSRVMPDVLLVDGDLRRAIVSNALGLSTPYGLTDVLYGSSSLTDAVTHWVSGEDPETTLDVLVAGVPWDDPSELFARPEMRELIRTARDKYSFVVIDAPPLLAVTDAALLADIGDGALLVVRSGRSTARDLAEAARALELAGGQLEGVALNAVHQPWWRRHRVSGSLLPWRR